MIFILIKKCGPHIFQIFQAKTKYKENTSLGRENFWRFYHCLEMVFTFIFLEKYTFFRPVHVYLLEFCRILVKKVCSPKLWSVEKRTWFVRSFTKKNQKVLMKIRPICVICIFDFSTTQWLCFQPKSIDQGVKWVYQIYCKVLFY